MFYKVAILVIVVEEVGAWLAFAIPGWPGLIRPTNSSVLTVPQGLVLV